MPLPGQSSGTETGEPHIQYAALPWRMPGKRLEILLLTSRDTGRWVIPKGWPKKGLRPWETAAEEAYEEGGIHGAIEQAALGWYDYSVFIFGYGLSPWLLGMLHDVYGSYQRPLMFSTFLAGLAVLLCLALPKTQRA